MLLCFHEALIKYLINMSFSFLNLLLGLTYKIIVFYTLNSFTHHNNPVKYVLLLLISPFYSYKNWGTEQFSISLTIRDSGAGIQRQTLWVQSLYFQLRFLSSLAKSHQGYSAVTSLFLRFKYEYFKKVPKLKMEYL